MRMQARLPEGEDGSDGPVAGGFTDEGVLDSALASTETVKLRRHVGRFDTMALLVCSVVSIDTLGAVSANGAQAFTWTAILAVVFVIPYGLIISELGSSFPGEGGPYLWPRLAFGRSAAAINTIFYWATNPIWLGGSLTILAITAFGEFFTPLSGAAKYLFALAFIWMAVLCAVLSLRHGKTILAIGAVVRVVLLGGLAVTVVIYGVEHGVHGFGVSDFSPTWATLVAAVPVLAFNFTGFELPNSAGGEMKNPQRDIPFAIVRSGAVSVALYSIPLLLILLVLPTSQISSIGGFLDTVKTVFTVYGGHIGPAGHPVLSGAGEVLGACAAVGAIIALFTAGAAWIIGSDRVLAVAALDGAAPARLGRFSARFGTPVAVNIVSGLLATTVMVLAFNLTAGNAGKYFSAVLGLAVSTTLMSYFLLFPALVVLRRRRGGDPRPFRVPGGAAGAWTCVGLATTVVLLAALCTVFPGFGTGSPDQALPAGFAGQRLAFELTQIVPLGVLVAVGALFYALGAPTRDTRARHRTALAGPGTAAPSATLEGQA